MLFETLGSISQRGQVGEVGRLVRRIPVLDRLRTAGLHRAKVEDRFPTVVEVNLYRFDWLARRVEEPVDPSRPIVDAHHHLWRHADGTYLAPELHADTSSGHNVVETVFVECRSSYDDSMPSRLAPVGETAFVAEQAAACTAAGGPTIGAIVSFADMMLGDAVEEVLLAHEEAGGGLFRGIRHATAIDPGIGRSHTDPTEGMMGTGTFRAGAAKLGAMGHCFDAWLFHPQLGELLDMARALPEVTIVLDHLGAPLGVGPYVGRQVEVEAALRLALDPIADCPNVVLKLGGIGMERYFGMGWFDADAPPSSDTVVERWQDQINWSIERFGPQRCMFESNYPVDRESLPYTVLWNALQKIASRYTDAEQDAMFSGTARRVYRVAS